MKVVYYSNTYYMCDKCGIVENTVNYDEELDCDLCIDCHFKDDVIND